jgi:hypothetical protein
VGAAAADRDASAHPVVEGDQADAVAGAAGG